MVRVQYGVRYGGGTVHRVRYGGYGYGTGGYGYGTGGTGTVRRDTVSGTVQVQHIYDTWYDYSTDMIYVYTRYDTYIALV